MRLTKFSDYALRVLLYAAANTDRLVTIEETAAVFSVSRAHLKKVVMTLVREGLLNGARGRSGGFALARQPEQINLGAVLRLTETDFAPFECLSAEHQCPIATDCRLSGLGDEAMAAFLAVFDNRTLADILVPAMTFPDVRATRDLPALQH
jgi:Rrf2 family transcriptional regulator, nitric oxide-sensitive transcriptional repressor